MIRLTLCLIIGIGLAGATFQAAAQNELTFAWRSFAQLTSEYRGSGDDGVGFGADRIRTRLEATNDRLTAGIMLDFGVDDLGDRKPGALANVIGDLYVNYLPWANHLVRVGQFKTPVGMDFNVSGRSLDLTKRGMEAGLVLNRDLGVMVSGRSVWSGLGYDIGVFNPAGRSGATMHEDDQVGGDIAPVVRLHYDATNWHLEVAHGWSQHAGGAGTPDYKVSDVGFRLRAADWTVKLEWTEGQDIQGVGGWDESVYYVHGGYQLRPGLELVGRHYKGRNTLVRSSTRLTNTYMGITANVWDDRGTSGRLQVNYVIAGGDEVNYSGIRGFRDDALLVQLQVSVEK